MSQMRVSVENIDAYTAHRLSEPTYPKTVIIPTNINEYSIHYAHGKPLSDFTVDDCPDSVFNYNCQYYQSLVALKKKYDAELSKVLYQLEAFDEDKMEDFINERIDEKYKNYSERLRADIEELSSMTAEEIIRDVSNGDIDASHLRVTDINDLNSDIMSDLSERQSELDSVESIAYDELYAEWFRVHETSPESKMYLTDIQGNLLLGLGKMDQEVRAWKTSALNDAIEYERNSIKEYQSIPHNITEFRKQLQTLQRTTIANLIQDIKNSVLDIILSKMPKSAIDKYEKQINTLILLHSKCKCHKYIDAFSEVIKNKITIAISKLKMTKFNETLDWYELKQYIFPLLESGVTNIYHRFFSEMNERLALVPKSDDLVTNMDGMKTVSRNIIASINENLDDMHTVINEFDYNELKPLSTAIANINRDFVVVPKSDE